MKCADSRRAERLCLSLPVLYTINLPNQQLSGSARTINVSGGGVQLSISQPVPPSTPCEVTLALPDSIARFTLNGHITWCRPSTARSARSRKVGIAFVSTETDHEPHFASYCHFIATKLFAKYCRMRALT